MCVRVAIKAHKMKIESKLEYHKYLPNADAKKHHTKTRGKIIKAKIVKINKINDCS